MSGPLTVADLQRESFETARAKGWHDHDDDACDSAGALGIDLDAVLRQKLAYNRGRPYRHGWKVA